MTEAGEKTAKLLGELWLRTRPIVEERLAMLDKAAAASAAGSLDEQLRTEAASSAHKLAGSLGMYGYDEGTRVARELEVMLSEAEPDAARLSPLILELRAAVFPTE
jgi:HPt (histidine-containing phosphotransfer) domain-containing protein